MEYVHISSFRAMRAPRANVLGMRMGHDMQCKSNEDDYYCNSTGYSRLIRTSMTICTGMAPSLLSCAMRCVLMDARHRHVKALAILLLALIFGP
jgi:hypothetical protein